MQAQTRITQPGNVLGPDGTLLQTGYSTESVLKFNRDAIKAPPWRVKEWDFYQVSNDDYCLQLTYGHVSYAGDVSIRLFEFKTGKRIDLTRMLILPFNRLKLPTTADSGNIKYEQKGFTLEFQVYPGGRRLICQVDVGCASVSGSLDGDAGGVTGTGVGTGIVAGAGDSSAATSGDERGTDHGDGPGAKRDVRAANGVKSPAVEIVIELAQPDPTSIIMVTPFDEGPRMFYYNHKINCMPASGYAQIGNHRYSFEPENNAFGLLDWGRGVWPFSQEWYWGSGSGWVNGKRFGFNIGYGFGNTAAATENILFYDGTAHKLSHVYFDLPGSGGYMAKKTFTSDDGRFEMTFTPIYDRYTETKLLFVDTRCHQIFGRFNGKAVLDSGEILEIRNLTAFTEHAVNNW